jgi:hypothetical protein
VNAGGAGDAAVVEVSELEDAGFRSEQIVFPPGRNVHDTLKDLFQRLDAAFTDEAASERERYIRALFALYLFLNFNGYEYANKFLTLRSGLEDLDKGTTASFLKPKAGRGRRHDPREIWFARARVAIGIEALLRAGDSKEEILKYIERHHRGLHSLMTLESDKTNLTGDKTDPLRSRAISFETSVLGWHYKFIKGKKTPDGSTNMFAYLKWDLDNRQRKRDSDPEARRKCLRNAAKLAFDRAAKIGLDFKQREELEESEGYAGE